MLTYVHAENAPAAIGPYSQAKIAGGFLFASGQIAINPATGEIDGTDILPENFANVNAIEALVQRSKKR